MVQCGKSIITDGTVKSMNDLEVLKAACCIAGLDEDVGFKERKVLQSLAERAGVDQAAFDAMMEMAVEDDDYFEGQLNLLQSNVDDAIKSLFRVAVTDGKLGSNERGILHHFAENLGMTGERFEQILTVAKREGVKSASHS